MTTSPEPGTSLETVATPALLLDSAALDRNLERMSALTTAGRVALRPHTKTHKSPLIAHRQMALGAVGICCAKLAEAEVMAEWSVPDILVTTPVIGRDKLARLMALAASVRMRVVVDDPVNVDDLAQAASAAHVTLDVLVEVDVGQGRCGVPPGDAAAVLAERIARASSLRFAGLQGYNGSIQGVVRADERTEKVRASLDRLLESAHAVRKRGIEVPVLTGGGTGTCLLDLAAGGLTEVQPGSYVVMDASYARVQRDAAGTALPFEPALTVLASVVSRPTPERVIVDVGWKSASMDSGLPVVKGRPDLLFEFAGDEHGRITSPGGGLALRPGDRVELVPSHCDTTINLHDEYVVIGERTVEAVWPVATRGNSQ